jgi:hypothetical protein
MTARHDDRFFGGPRTKRVTSEGPVDLPIFYYDTSNVVAVFRASRAGALKLLDGTGLDPTLAGDDAIVALSFYEYRDTSVGVYNEVGTAILAARRGEGRAWRGLADVILPPSWRATGAYVVDLPVTTAAADAAGREIWGYPKFVTRIEFRLREGEFEGAVLDPATKESIVTLSGRMGPGVPAPPMSLVTFSTLDGTLVRTHVTVRGTVTVHAPGTVRLSVGRSAHRMAENLRTLRLVDARPFFVMRTDRFQSRLPLGAHIPEKRTGQ